MSELEIQEKGSFSTILIKPYEDYKITITKDLRKSITISEGELYDLINEYFEEVSK